MYSRADSTAGNGLARPKSTAACISSRTADDQLLGPVGGHRPLGDEPAAERRHGIALLRCLVLLRVAELLDRLVLGEVEGNAGRGDDVAVGREPVHLRLDERRAVTGAGARDGGADRLVHPDRITAVDRHARHAVRLRLDREILAVRAVRVFLVRTRMHVVAVVLHHEHDRQLPERSDVERLRERALLGSAVAEEAEDDLALLADLRRPGGAGGVRDSRPDDPRGAEEAVRDVGQVHRAADALAYTVAAPVDLGHHRVHVGAAHDRVAVAAVRREELVFGAERRDRADDRRLGAVGEVRVATDHTRVLQERALDPLLELANPQHLVVHPDEPVAVEIVSSRCAHVGSLPIRIGRRSSRKPAGR